MIRIPLDQKDKRMLTAKGHSGETDTHRVKHHRHQFLPNLITISAVIVQNNQ